jgi:hypothetical protein
MDHFVLIIKETQIFFAERCALKRFTDRPSQDIYNAKKDKLCALLSWIIPIWATQK